jgi:hypothetical protein
MRVGRDIVVWTIERFGTDIDVIVKFQFCAGRPAKLYGLPENCYPAEPDEVHFESVMAEPRFNVQNPGRPVEINLTDDEYDAIETWILDNPPEPDYPEDM